MPSKLTYEPTILESLSDIATRISSLASQSRRTVTAMFNGIEINAEPGTNPMSIIADYDKESQRRHDKYINSPMHKEEQRQLAEAKRSRDEKRQEVLSTAPEKMAIRDQATWDTYVEKNTSGYGAATLRYAEMWARMMEAQMAKGATLETCAEELSHLADVEAISGFMYGVAVDVLTKVWIHGEELRRWFDGENH